MQMTQLTQKFSFAQFNFSALRATVCGFWLLLIFASTVGASLAHAAAPAMLRPVSVESLVAKGVTAKSALVATPKGIKSAASAVEFDADTLHALAVGTEVSLALPSGKQYLIVKESQTTHEDGSTTWVGYFKDVGKQYKVIATTGPNGTYANINAPDEEWLVSPSGYAGFDFLVNATRESELNPIPADKNDVRYSPEFDVDGKPGRALTESTAPVGAQPINPLLKQAMQNAKRIQAAFPQAKAAPTPTATIDVLVVVTRGFANFHGANMMARINQLFANANAAYNTSEVAIQANRVGAVIVRDYSDTVPDKGGALDAVTNNVGVFADIESIRNSVGADLVALLRNVNEGGVAWLGAINGMGTANETWGNTRSMYSVTGICNFGTQCDAVFIHELGHNMGLQHNRADAGTPFSRARAYSFGWRVTSGTSTRDFRTIMSYAPPNNRVLLFSNPNLFICNSSTWLASNPADACGVANSEDNARTLNENRFMLAALKSATNAAIPTTLVLSATSTRYPRQAGTATASVFRLGDGTGAVTVNFATANGTGIAGQDYTPTSGTLSWAAGDTANKTISVPLLAGTGSGDRLFTLTLSGAAGPAGTAIANPSTLTFRLVSDGVWPIGNVMPAWTQLSGTASNWGINSTEASEGAFSVKSGQTGDSQTSGTTFTAAMGAGNLTFFRKVSSEQGFDFFRVFVDNVEFTPAAASGDVGWTLVTIPVAAGMRTVSFRYTKDGSVFSGADSAWIDQLRYPAPSASDLSADGRSDILLRNTDGSLYGLLMNGTASTSGAYITTGNTWSVAATGDLNGDGKADIVLRNNNDGSLYALLMDGTASTSGAYITTGNTWSVAATGDLNGDGKADIVLRQTDGSLYLLLMNGAAVQSGAYLTTGNTWTLANTSSLDLNGDGRSDIILRQTDGSLYAMLMNGTTVQSGAYLTTGNTWTLANTADLNGDGRSDIVLRQTDGSLYAMLMNGTAVTSGAYLTTGATWALANVSNTDLNGDGRADIILRHTDGSLYLLIMNGTAVSSGAYLTTGNTWSFRTAADYNGDGKSDIVIQNTDGSSYILIMNGTAVTSGAYLLGPASPWTVTP
jgi:hypothetical protein